MRRTSGRKCLHLIVLVGMLAGLASCDSAGPVPPVPAAASQPQPISGQDAVTKSAPDRPSPENADSSEGANHHASATKQFPPNRLADETSPYLLLHAHNPVKWYAWGDEALAKAKAENKLIFLSIGYSSCYWCHVMERESFMDEEIADLLNEHFVAVKVDREERPDIDDIYMTALQVYLQAAGAGGSGGWPLSMFLTPDAQPILGGTYFPPRDAQGRTGFLTVLGRIHDRWQEDPQSFRDSADRLTEFVVQTMKLRAPLAPPGSADEIADSVQQALASQYDAQYGGFGYNAADPRRPKFPEPSNLLFLLNRAGDAANEQARTMAVETLQNMAAGGIRDHLGGGFHRYSTDRFWKIPHFEKMLYDNAQLVSAYAEAFALTGDAQFRIVVDEILAFVAREMTDPSGAFYAALDAETEAEEGRFYAWDEAELKQVLAAEEFALFGALYISAEGPNFEGRYVPLLVQSRQEAAAQLNLTQEEFDNRLSDVKSKLLAARNQRPRPLTDTKILTSWNGLMIRGLADAGRLLEDDAYVQAAARAADFVLVNLRREDGRLWRTYGQEQAKLNAYLDDYAFLIDGLIALHRATGQERWLQAADGLMAKQVELFWDDESGGFYFTSHDHEQLLTRSKDPIDTVLPSGNAVSVGNLVYLANHLDRPTYPDSAQRTVRAFAGYLEELPAGMTRMALSASALQAAGPAEEADETQ